MGNKISDKEVIDYYKEHTISATYYHFKCGLKKIEDILERNGISKHTKEENDKIISKINRECALKREAAKKEKLNEEAVICFYNNNGLAKTAQVFHISSYYLKRILKKYNAIKPTEQVLKEARERAKDRFDEKYDNILGDIISFYNSHTLNYTANNFHIHKRIIKRLFLKNNIPLHSKEREIELQRIHRVNSYKESVKKKYLTIYFDSESQAIKEEFLKLNSFLDNNFLIKYIDLISANLNTVKQKHKTQGHHIIPKSYFKLNKLPINNLSSNMVNLSYKDHILAHYYLALCSEGEFKEANLKAFNQMTLGEIKLDMSELDIVKKLDNYQSLREEYSILNGKVKSIDNKYRIHIYRGQKKKMIKKEELENYIKKGWKEGRGQFRKRGKEIICIDINRTFSNISDAAKSMDINPVCIRNSIKRNILASEKFSKGGGYYWAYADDIETITKLKKNLKIS